VGFAVLVRPDRGQYALTCDWSRAMPEQRTVRSDRNLGLAHADERMVEVP
jgi:hypothetical protein